MSRRWVGGKHDPTEQATRIRQLLLNVPAELQYARSDLMAEYNLAESRCRRARSGRHTAGKTSPRDYQVRGPRAGSPMLLNRERVHERRTLDQRRVHPVRRRTSSGRPTE